MLSSLNVVAPKRPIHGHTSACLVYLKLSKTTFRKKIFYSKVEKVRKTIELVNSIQTSHLRLFKK